MDFEKSPSTEISQKNLEPISFFEKDVGFVFSYKKTEKLASALYMITSLFPDNEPMKWTLRKKAGEILSIMVSYKDVPKAGEVDFIYNIKTRTLELVSLLEVSVRGGLVSQMNFSVLNQEFSNLINTMESAVTSPREIFSETISRSFFTTEKTFPVKEGVSIGHRPYSGDVVHYSDMRDKVIIADKSAFKRSARQNTILNLLKRKKELTIKDIALVIKDCSEKTIQRELIAFIKAGVLVRTGERRWSKYFLKN